VGNPHIFGRIKTLTDRLIEGLQEHGYMLRSSVDRRERSGIVLFNHARHESKEVSQALRRAGIVVAIRNGSVRASPHYYNTEDEVDAIMAEIKRLSEEKLTT
jgi:selenocysteine lyase/cysteine desulfurase